MTARSVNEEERMLSLIASSYLLVMGLVIATERFDPPIGYVLTDLLGLPVQAGPLSIGTTVLGFGMMIAGFLLSFRISPKELNQIRDPEARNTGR